MTRLTVILCAALLASCSSLQPEPMAPSEGHLKAPPPVVSSTIPEPIRQMPILPEPAQQRPLETYTVVVSDVPVRDLLFALARDANLNIDIFPGIDGSVTINALDQTLPQILERIKRQVDLKYALTDDGLVIEPDIPYIRTYRVDYLNLARNTNYETEISTNVFKSGGEGDAGGGDTNSTTKVSSAAENAFWTMLESNVQRILGETVISAEIRTSRNAAATAGRSGRTVESRPRVLSNAVIANPSAGLLTVNATERQHQEVQSYIDLVTAAARRQVLIEATVVEVSLTDDYQAGVDWSRLARETGLSVTQSLLSNNLGNAPFLLLDYASYRDPVTGDPSGSIAATVRLLSQFGNTKVLSTPKLMALNNQTAMLKVVENLVYFEVESTTVSNANNTDTNFTTTAKTVPVGFIMAITPQIAENGSITLAVRPTISRFVQNVPDPNPDLVIANNVPQIETREMESVLRLNNGQIAVLGGLMTDTETRDNAGVPGLAKAEGIGPAFRYTDDSVQKTELVVFIRPIVVREPSIDRDLKHFNPFLQKAMASPPAKPDVEMVQ